MAVVSTGLLTAGVRSEFFERLAQVTTYYGRLATRIESNRDQESYRWLGAPAQMREWGTGRLARGLRSESYDVRNLKYESTIEVDRDEISDDQTGQIRLRVQDMATRAATHKDGLIGALLEAGATAGSNSYDGVTFFNDAHVRGASGSQDNDLVWDISDNASGGTAAAPTALTLKGAIQQAVGAMMAFRDDQGEPMMLGTSGIAVLVPPNMYWPAAEALGAAMLANTSNVLAGSGIDLIAYPYLSSTDKFYTCYTGGAIRPFIFQDREPLEFTALDAADTDEAFRREKYLYGVRARYRVYYGEPLYCVRTTIQA